MTDYTPEGLARLFHETYERLAPRYDYRTREASAKPWEDVPEQNRVLMVATCAEVIARWAGRLLPEDARTEWAIELFPAEENGGKPYIVQTETGSEEHARSVAGTGPGKLIRRQVGPWVPVPKPEPDMSTAPDASVGAHFEAHSAHTPAVPEGAEPPCGLPPGLCGDDEDCRLPPCQPASVVPGEEQA